MANPKQVDAWLNMAHNQIKRKVNNAENDLIKQIWETEFKDFKIWAESIQFPKK